MRRFAEQNGIDGGCPCILKRDLALFTRTTAPDGFQLKKSPCKLSIAKSSLTDQSPNRRLESPGIIRRIGIAPAGDRRIRPCVSLEAQVDGVMDAGKRAPPRLLKTFSIMRLRIESLAVKLTIGSLLYHLKQIRFSPSSAAEQHYLWARMSRVWSGSSTYLLARRTETIDRRHSKTSSSRESEKSYLWKPATRGFERPTVKKTHRASEQADNQIDVAESIPVQESVLPERSVRRPSALLRGRRCSRARLPWCAAIFSSPSVRPNAANRSPAACVYEKTSAWWPNDWPSDHRLPPKLPRHYGLQRDSGLQLQIQTACCSLVMMAHRLSPPALILAVPQENAHSRSGLGADHPMRTNAPVSLLIAKPQEKFAYNVHGRVAPAAPLKVEVRAAFLPPPREFRQESRACCLKHSATAFACHADISPSVAQLWLGGRLAIAARFSFRRVACPDKSPDINLPDPTVYSPRCRERDLSCAEYRC